MIDRVAAVASDQPVTTAHCCCAAAGRGQADERNADQRDREPAAVAKSHRPSDQQAQAATNSPGDSVLLWQAVQQCRGINMIVNLLGCCWVPSGGEIQFGAVPRVVDDATPRDEVACSPVFSPDPPVPRGGRRA